MRNAKTTKINKRHDHDKARPRSTHIAPRLLGKDYQRSATRTWALKAGNNHSSWLRSQGVKNNSEQTLTAHFCIKRGNIKRTLNTLPGESNPSECEAAEHDSILKQSPQKPRSLLHGIRGFALRALCCATAPVSSRLHHGWLESGASSHNELVHLHSRPSWCEKTSSTCRSPSRRLLAVTADKGGQEVKMPPGLLGAIFTEIPPSGRRPCEDTSGHGPFPQRKGPAGSAAPRPTEASKLRPVPPREDQVAGGQWLPFPGEGWLICKMAARERERPLLAWRWVGASG